MHLYFLDRMNKIKTTYIILHSTKSRWKKKGSDQTDYNLKTVSIVLLKTLTTEQIKTKSKNNTFNWEII